MGLFFTTHEEIAIKNGCPEQVKDNKFLWFKWKSLEPHDFELKNLHRS